MPTPSLNQLRILGLQKIRHNPISPQGSTRETTGLVNKEIPNYIDGRIDGDDASSDCDLDGLPNDKKQQIIQNGFVKQEGALQPFGRDKGLFKKWWLPHNLITFSRNLCHGQWDRSNTVAPLDDTKGADLKIFLDGIDDMAAVMVQTGLPQMLVSVIQMGIFAGILRPIKMGADALQDDFLEALKEFKDLHQKKDLSMREAVPLIYQMAQSDQQLQKDLGDARTSKDAEKAIRKVIRNLSQPNSNSPLTVENLCEELKKLNTPFGNTISDLIHRNADADPKELLSTIFQLRNISKSEQDKAYHALANGLGALGMGAMYYAVVGFFVNAVVVVMSGGATIPAEAASVGLLASGQASATGYGFWNVFAQGKRIRTINDFIQACEKAEENHLISPKMTKSLKSIGQTMRLYTRLNQVAGGVLGVGQSALFTASALSLATPFAPAGLGAGLLATGASATFAGVGGSATSQIKGLKAFSHKSVLDDQWLEQYAGEHTLQETIEHLEKMACLPDHLLAWISLFKEVQKKEFFSGHKTDFFAPKKRADQFDLSDIQQKMLEEFKMPLAELAKKEPVHRTVVLIRLISLYKKAMKNGKEPASRDITRVLELEEASNARGVLHELRRLGDDYALRKHFTVLTKIKKKGWLARRDRSEPFFETHKVRKKLWFEPPLVSTIYQALQIWRGQEPTPLRIPMWQPSFIPVAFLWPYSGKAFWKQKTVYMPKMDEFVEALDNSTSQHHEAAQALQPAFWEAVQYDIYRSIKMELRSARFDIREQIARIAFAASQNPEGFSTGPMHLIKA